jgi:threonine/homoserine/homoserine lactone efflux protein
MTLFAFLSAVLALLATPGPTNTLMALAGAEGGVGRVARLLPAELAGYLTTILPLVWLGSALHALGPAPALALKAAAALWVMLLAIRLWRRPPAAATGPHVTARQVYVTTMLNPKALVFGLVLLPAPTDADFAVRLALFCLMVVAVAVVWGSGGAATRVRGGGPGRLVALRRLASAWLAVVSLMLMASVVWA